MDARPDADAMARPDEISTARTERSPRPNAPDVVLVGGGLASSLIAYRLASQRPDLTLLMIERDAQVGGHHTWSFHETDLNEEATGWIDPLVAKRWDAQRIEFPARQRGMRSGYRSLTSASVRAGLAALPNIRTATGVEVTGLEADGVTLADGETVPAPLVIDARGHGPGSAAAKHLVLAWQKFFGMILDVPAGHGVPDPVIMDATVEQIDGFRFVYLLPQDERRILVEDTRYADGPELDREGMEAEVRAYAAAKGWEVADVVHREEGVLPIALAHDAPAMWDAMPEGAVPVGMRAGLFHAMTGYSLPIAVRVADLVAASPDLTSAAVRARVEAFARAEHRRQWFFRFLARMLFRGCEPERRWRLMQRFYGLGEGLVERFYAGSLLPRDKLRLVSGRPPIPIHRGLLCMPERPFLRDPARSARPNAPPALATAAPKDTR